MAHTFSIYKKCESMNKVNSEQALAKAPTCGKCGESLPMHGLVTEVSSAGLQKLIAKSDQPIVADFWASWCGPCRAYAPQFEEASLKNKNAVFVKVDTESNPSVSQQLGIRGIPTTIFFNQGTEKLRQSGVIPEDAISQLLTRV